MARTRRTPTATPPAIIPTLPLDFLAGTAVGEEELVGWEDCGALEGAADPEVEDAGDPKSVRQCYCPACKRERTYLGL
jgi:hypothetical protein